VRLRYTLPALADLDAILDCIAAHSPQGAKRVQARIQTIIDLLLLHPHIGTRTNNPAIHRLATPPYPYVVFYEATATEIIMYAVRHQARNLPGCRARPKHIAAIPEADRLTRRQCGFPSPQPSGA